MHAVQPLDVIILSSNDYTGSYHTFVNILPKLANVLAVNHHMVTVLGISI